jgi:hypothetical protein
MAAGALIFEKAPGTALKYIKIVLNFCLEYTINKRRDYKVLLKKNRDNSDNYKRKKQ